MLSHDLRLALGPSVTYQQLVAERTDSTWRAALAPLALSLLVTGSLVAMMATGRVTVDLVVTAAVSWSFAFLVQAVAASALIVSSRRRPVTARRAFELLFLGHAPWSLWLLAFAALAVVGNLPIGSGALVASAALPMAWTVVILIAFCRTVLGTTPGGARLRTAAHQVLTIGFGLSYIAWAAGGWLRIVESVAP